jgi:hypothetical protein
MAITYAIDDALPFTFGGTFRLELGKLTTLPISPSEQLIGRDYSAGHKAYVFEIARIATMQITEQAISLIT